MIRIKGLTKEYKAEGVVTKALNGINLEIEDGEFIAIMGASGSGKSTLLHILGGMDRLTEGEYFYDDKKIHEMSMKELGIFRREYVSFVFQNFALMKYYSVAKNIEMPLLSMNINKSERKRIVNECMEKVGISHLAKKRPTHISGGEQGRCAIARALASGSKLFLADEPTGALDRDTGKEIMKVIKSVHEMGKTVILITHDPKVAEYADRIIRIVDGKIEE